jgi:hypothetical protein
MIGSIRGAKILHGFRTFSDRRPGHPLATQKEII